MPLFKVYAEVTLEAYTFVEAENEEAAMDIAEERVLQNAPDNLKGNDKQFFVIDSFDNGETTILDDLTEEVEE